MRNMTRDASGHAAVIRAPFDGAQLRVGDDIVHDDDERRRSRDARRVAEGRPRVHDHEGGRRPVSRGLRRRRAGAAGGDGLEHVLARDVRVLDEDLALQGLLGDGDRAAADVVAGRVVAGMHRLPQHAAARDDALRRSVTARRCRRIRARCRIACCPHRGRGPRARPTCRGSSACSPTRSASWAARSRWARCDEPAACRCHDDGAQARRRSPRRARHRLRGLPQRRGGACAPSRRSSRRSPRRAACSRSIRRAARPARARSGSTTRARSAIRCCSTRYPFDVGGRSCARKNPGGSSISSGEGRDFQLGGCSTQMACTTCHDPHTEDPKAKLAAARHAGGQSRVHHVSRAVRERRRARRAYATTSSAARAPRASRATWRRRTWGSTTC